METEKLCEKMLKLAAAQKKLRAALEKKMASDRLERGEVAKNAEVSWKFVNEILAATMVARGGDQLPKLTQYLGCDDLLKEITTVAEGLSDRLCGFAIFSNEVITLVFKIFSSYESVAEEGSIEEFAAAFGEYNKIIAGILSCSREAAAELEQNLSSIANIVNETLWVDSWEEIKSSRQQRFKIMATELTELREQIMQSKSCGTEQAAKLLGVHPSTVARALQGKVSEATLTDLITKAKKLLDEKEEKVEEDDGGEEEPETAVPPSAAPVSTPVAITSSSPTFVDVIRQYGGGESPLGGVPFALTPATFQHIEGDPGDAFVDTVVMYLRGTRAMLNICAQIKDDKIRERIRLKLSHELEELGLTLQQVSFEIPSNLTEFYDAQRQTWAKNLSKPVRRGR